MRNNCFIYIVDAPVSENLDEELKKTFGDERAVHLYRDLVGTSYKLAANFKDDTVVISYKRAPKYPDLTWLDDNDPGFLEPKTQNLGERIYHAFRWGFNDGAQKALMLFTNVPRIETEWIKRAINYISPGRIVLGPAGEKPYLLGLCLENIAVLKEINFNAVDLVDNILERARRNRIEVDLLPESFAVKDEESLRKWLESKEDNISLFAREEVKEHKKKGKRQSHREEFHR